MLSDYNKKRNFKKTPEPSGKVKKTTGELRFVVQKHQATRLHYDFRIELDGVLKSWAVPKGPSLNPKNKRLAMMVEDHPINYYDFEGVIPEGNYGAGTVMVWDKGTYYIPTSKNRKITEKVVTDELKRGNIKITLRGEKLRGEFALVKLKNTPNAWLMIKHRDQYVKRFDEEKDYSVLSGRSMEQIAEERDREWDSRNVKSRKMKVESTKNKDLGKEVPGARSRVRGDLDLTGAFRSDFPSNLSPTLATLVDEPFDSKDWIFEDKLDGYRALARLSDKGIELLSRNNINLNDKYPEIVESLKKIKFEAIFDGEIVVINEKGDPEFQLLQQYQLNKTGKLAYCIFDILYFNGFDLRNVKLIDRKKILKKVLKSTKNIKVTKYINKEGRKLFRDSKRRSEGIIAKRKDSVYEYGARTSDWLKVKSRKRQEFIICGFTEPFGTRKILGSLILGLYKRGKLVPVGNVGTGFNHEILEELKKKLDPLIIKKSPFEDSPKNIRNVTWVKPKLICEVEFAGWTEGRNVRQASFIGLREDKSPKEVVKEKPLDTPEVLERSEVPGKLELSNLEKVYWPKEGYTKKDLIDYYKDVSKFILPHLKDRPESLHRQPNGIRDEGFFQKDVDENVPEWVKTISIESDSKDKDIKFMVCNNVETLIFMANWGCIEIHPWSSRIQSLDYPDYSVFDLDPLGTSFRNVVKVALEIRDIFDQLEIESFVKTSGSRGIHIYVPLGAQYTYEQSRQFAKIVELMVNSRLPNLTSLERDPSARRGKVYLDYLQNGRGKTMTSVYSVRPKPGATVSTPLRWEEVNENLDPSKFTIKTIRRRLDRTGDLWKNLYDRKINMAKTLEELNEFVGRDLKVIIK